jgi:hypothetical protein
MGSGVDAVQEAVLVKVPASGAITVRVKLAVPPLLRVGRVGQVTTPPLARPPPVALKKLAPAGNTSVSATLLAEEGPKLVTVIV